MNRLGKKLSALAILATLVSCTCATPLVVSEIQKSDKKLTCKDIILEINEAEHYKDLAKKERGIGFGNALMPVCWASSYVDAAKSVDAANARVAYLGKIYDVLDCGGKSDRSAAGTPPGMMPPPFIQVQPAQQYSPPQYSQPVERQQMPKLPKQDFGEEEVDDDVPAPKGEVDDKAVRKNSHQHIDKLGKVYTHSHPYAGPHRHAEDQ